MRLHAFLPTVPDLLHSTTQPFLPEITTLYPEISVKYPALAVYPADDIFQDYRKSIFHR